MAAVNQSPGGCGCTASCDCAAVIALFPQTIGATIHATHSVLGAFTLTYNGSAWVGSISYSYPGYSGTCSCAAATVTVTLTLLKACKFNYAWNIDGATGCPVASGGFSTSANETRCSPVAYTCGGSPQLIFSSCVPRQADPCSGARDDNGLLLGFGSGTAYTVTFTL